jgi:phage tail-like protein
MGVLGSMGVGLGIRTDPPLTHNFLISLLDTSSSGSLAGSIALSFALDVVLGGFSECSGLEMSMQPEEYKEGGQNGCTLKFPSRVTWGNIILKRGIGAWPALWDWHYGYATGEGKRRDGVITLVNDMHLPTNIWFFSRGLPVKYTGPTLNASQNTVAVESIEIAHEGIYQVPGISAGTAAVMAAVSLGMAHQ